ncbi:MAG: AbrB/MazE/SpoVT family DNA-binding domain-containing protein [Coriobacteriia bacterium]|nr:AbrB/MazE/SpoVT family DNA-binding domain-containing protein [Coriobacteriia bacterium]
MRATAKVTSKGQVTIPIDVREGLGIMTGDSLVFEVKAGYATVSRQRSALDVAEEQLARRGESIARHASKEEAIAAYFRDRGKDEDHPERYVDELFVIGGAKEPPE